MNKAITFEKIIFFFALFISLIFLIVPANPSMPSQGLDPSWVLGINEAIGKHFAFGKEVIFTFGPYANLYTKQYHPDTYWLTKVAGFYLVTLFSITLFLNFLKTSSYLKVGIILILICFQSSDTLFYFYILSIGELYCKLRSKKNSLSNLNINFNYLLALLLGSLMLITFIKGSFSIASMAITLVIFVDAALNKKFRLLVNIFLSIVLNILFFWLLSHQKITDLLNYFTSIIPIINGYSEAMGLLSNKNDIYAYLFSSLIILITILIESNSEFKTRLIRALIYFLVIFTVFKAGFVRDDGHSIMSGFFMLYLALMLATINYNGNFQIAIFFALVSWAVTDYSYGNTFTSRFKEIVPFYINSLKLSHNYFNDESLLKNYNQRLEAIKASSEIPLMSGSSDIYSFDQADLISSDNVWNPRPIFQSYSVYTLDLIQKNIDHLLGSNAPDNIIFRLQPIDGRLPSMADGSSWPTIFEKYDINKMISNTLYFKKSSSTKVLSEKSLLKGVYKFGEIVKTPSSTGLLFFKVNIKPSSIGKVIGVLYKPSQLTITLQLANGVSRQYRIVSGMIKNVILISPLVENTSDVFLINVNPSLINQKNVISFSIDSADRKQWKDSIEIEFIEHNLPINNNLLSIMEIKNPLIPLNESTLKTAKSCDLTIDSVDGKPFVTAKIYSSKLLEISGWIAESAKDGVRVDEKIFILKDKRDESQKFILNASSVNRPDVANYFHQDTLNTSGFNVSANLFKLKGEYTLAPGFKKNGDIFICPTPLINLSLN